ncbi:MAG: hypothetical protein L0H63_16420, partial [Nitrococcus sp.]|nr:hypothetical protein [Nitrococcus sp.]
TRMAIQHTRGAMLSAPLEVENVIFGEILWAATKALFNSPTILLVAALVGLVYGWRALLGFWFATILARRRLRR